MKPRGGRAVIEQRLQEVDEDDRRNDFPTQPWGTRALIEKVVTRFIPLADLKTQVCWEPAAGRGYMSYVLGGYFAKIYESDAFQYGDRYGQIPARPLGSFVYSPRHGFDRAISPPPAVDWVITNPPFKLALEFCQRGIKIGRVGCAMLCRTSFKEGAKRYNELFSTAPPTVIATFSERLALVKGRMDLNASTMTSYTWFVWLRGVCPQPPIWIPPGSKSELTREGDSLL